MTALFDTARGYSKLAPSFARAIAVARPIPELPPVKIATLICCSALFVTEGSS